MRGKIVNRSWKEVTDPVFNLSRGLFGDDVDKVISLARKYARLLDRNIDGSRVNKAIAGVYVAAKVSGCHISQKLLAKKMGTTNVTIRKWVELLIPLIEEREE